MDERSRSIRWPSASAHLSLNEPDNAPPVLNAEGEESPHGGCRCQTNGACLPAAKGADGKSSVQTSERKPRGDDANHVTDSRPASARAFRFGLHGFLAGRLACGFHPGILNCPARLPAGPGPASWLGSPGLSFIARRRVARRASPAARGVAPARGPRARVVGGMETLPLEYDSGSPADEAPDRSSALGAVRERVVGHHLKLVKAVAALLALVLVGGHVLVSLHMFGTWIRQGTHLARRHKPGVPASERSLPSGCAC